MTDPARYRAYLDVVSGRRRGFRAAALRGALVVASGPYAAAVALRNLAFDLHLRRVTRVEVPVVSVGNITAGGTGKTPLVEWVARFLRGLGVRVAILSRGYGAAPLPEDRAGQVGNDETALLSRNLPDVPHLVDADRVRSARVAIDELGMECLVLDDGFQHRRLARDLDLVTVDGLNPFGYGALLPRGLLREPRRSLRRADVIVLTRCDQAGDVAALRRRVERLAPGIPVLESRHAPVELTAGDGGGIHLDWLRTRKVLAVCGIGNPQAFRRTLADLGAMVCAFLAWPDHHAYDEADRRAVEEAAHRDGVEAVVTTQKDLAKLLRAGADPRTTFALRVQLQFAGGAAPLEERLRALVKPPARARG